MTAKKNTLTITDISAIIEKCGECRVQFFEFNGLKIEFYNSEKPNSMSSKEAHPEETEETMQSIIETAESIQKDVDLEDTAEEFMNLHITNPQLYEETLANPELMEGFERVLDEKES